MSEASESLAPTPKYKYGFPLRLGWKVATTAPVPSRTGKTPSGNPKADSAVACGNPPRVPQYILTGDVVALRMSETVVVTFGKRKPL